MFKTIEANSVTSSSWVGFYCHNCIFRVYVLVSLPKNSRIFSASRAHKKIFLLFKKIAPTKRFPICALCEVGRGFFIMIRGFKKMFFLFCMLSYFFWFILKGGGLLFFLFFFFFIYALFSSNSI